MKFFYGGIQAYGQLIGIASMDIGKGEHVHTHYLKFGEIEREFNSKNKTYIKQKSNDNFYFDGYRRRNGRSGTRNYIGLLSTVNCSATVVKKIANNFI